MPLQAQNQANIQAATGFGGFDLQLVPGAGANILNVSVNLFMHDARPGGAAPTVNSFLAGMRHNIQNDWNDKFVLRNGGDDVTVRFIINQAVNLGGAHFAVLLNNGAYGAGSGLKFATNTADPCGVGAGNTYLELQSDDNLPYYQGGAAALATGMINVDRMGVLLNERTRVVGASPSGTQAFDVVMNRTGFGWVVDPPSRPGLNAFCASITNTPGWLVQPPLKIHAESGIQDKADALVAAMRNYLVQRGVTSRLTLEAESVRKKWHKPFKGHKAQAMVRVEVDSINEMVKNWQSDYVVTSHEFGHILGLPDEYLDYSAYTNATIRQSQPNWDNLCTAAGVPQRNWHGIFCESMMSIGKRLYKSHATTIWRALDNMTQNAPNNLAANSWQIVAP